MRFESFAHMLAFWAENSPDAPALVQEEKTISFKELKEAAAKRAAALEGLEKTCEAIFAEPSIECITEIFAASAAGLQIVMLDAGLPDGLLSQLLVYTDADCLWSSDRELAEDLSPFLSGRAEGGRDRILFFTSGTTSRSKAVVLTGRSLMSSAWNGSELLPLFPGDRLLCMLPLAHVFGFVCGLLWGLSCGACVALGRGVRHYMDDIAYYRPSAVSLVPSLLAFLLKAGALSPAPATVLIGAGDCSPQLLEALSSMGVRCCFGYGLTETSSGVALSVGGDPYAMDICPDVKIEIAEDGEILISDPPCMMQGYYKDPDSTKAVLSGGVLKSGDLGQIDENGRLHITGRKKDMLVLSDGTKIFLPEYEKDLAGVLSNPEIAVILKGGRPALVFSGKAEKAQVAEAIKPLMATLPRGQQIAEIIITDEALPRTATGKIKRWELSDKVGK